MTFSFARNVVACIAVRASLFARVFILTTLAGPAWAATEPHGELTLKQAIEAALIRNPELAVSSYALQAADARITQAGLRPNPEISIQFENFAGTGQVSGIKSLETTLSLSQVVELGGKRGHRIDVAQFDGAVSGIARQAQQLDVLAEVTRRFIQLAAAQQDVALSRRASELSEQTLAVVTTRVQAARTPLAEQSRANIAVTRAHIEQQQAENNLQGAKRMLAAMWGSTQVEFDSAVADLFVLPSVASFDALSVKLQNNPDFLRFASEARLRDAELRLEQSRAKPNLTFSAGVRRLEATDNVALVAGFSMALPTRDRNQGAIREAEIRREQLRSQSQTAFIKADALLYGLYLEMSTARMRVETLSREAIPEAEAALRQVKEGHDRGRFSYLELATAQTELLELQRANIYAAADFHFQVAEIERLTNTPLLANSP